MNNGVFRSVDWLFLHLRTNKDIVILDATYSRTSGITSESLHDEEHIPNSIFFDILAVSDTVEAKNSSIAPHSALGSHKQFCHYISSLGIENKSHIVVYDNNKNLPISSACYVWWLFRLNGHPNVNVIENGLNGWKALGLMTTSVRTATISRNYKMHEHAHIYRKKFMITHEELSEIIENDSVGLDLVDVRPSRDGAIARSVNIPITKFIDPVTGRCKNLEDIEELFIQKKIYLNSDIIIYCNSGIMASIAACLIHDALVPIGVWNPTDKLAGCTIYPGSWTEWSKVGPSKFKIIITS
ncbi:hypothetical protein SNEBB_001744 [Seison nebaliae]|nr:hypothetical protein SNEBB_001744 [Seison nebaliae]